MIDHLAWPFFEPRHRALAEEMEEWCRATIHDAEASDPDYACRALVLELGRAGFLKLCVSDGESRPQAIARADEPTQSTTAQPVWRLPGSMPRTRMNEPGL